MSTGFKAYSICATTLVSVLLTLPAGAQGYQFNMNGLNSTAASGSWGNQTYRTGGGPSGGQHTRVANPTTQQNSSITLPTSTMGLAPVIGGGGLPPTTLDSFVVQAGGNADLIYGDEGTDDIPPFFGYDQSHRINAGISGDNSGLTTNHGSVLPNATGGDEFVQTEAWTMSGANNGNPYGFGAGGPGGAGASNPSGSNLAGLQGVLANSTWAQNHPRQNQVLTDDSVLYNQINADYGSLGGNYNQLANQALSIQNQDIADAAQNGGFITTAQQAQMTQEETTLGQQVQADSGF